MTSTVPAPSPGAVIWADPYPTPGDWASAVDARTRVHVLRSLFAKLGHPDVLRASVEALALAERLDREAQLARVAAEGRYQELRTQLGRGQVDAAAVGREVQDLAAWLDSGPMGDRAPLAVKLAADASQDCVARAGSLLPAEAPALYGIAQREAAAAVAATAKAPKLSDRIWSAVDPSVVAVEEGAELVYAVYQREQAKFSLCHDVGRKLRQLGGLGADALNPAPVSDADAFCFKRWDLAVGHGQETRRLRPPLRLRYAIDHGWEPGLYRGSEIPATPPPREPTPQERWAKLRGWISSGASAKPTIEVM